MYLGVFDAERPTIPTILPEQVTVILHGVVLRWSFLSQTEVFYNNHAADGERLTLPYTFSHF